MKKILAFLLAAAMVLSFAACGSNTSDSAETQQSEVSSESSDNSEEKTETDGDAEEDAPEITDLSADNLIFRIDDEEIRLSSDMTEEEFASENICLGGTVYSQDHWFDINYLGADISDCYVEMPVDGSGLAITLQYTELSRLCLRMMLTENGAESFPRLYINGIMMGSYYTDETAEKLAAMGFEDYVPERGTTYPIGELYEEMEISHNLGVEYDWGGAQVLVNSENVIVLINVYMY